MDPIGSVTGFFLNQGTLGVFIIVLMGVIYLQDKRSRADLKEKDLIIKEKELAIAILQEKRVADSNTNTTGFITNSQSLLNQMEKILDISTSNQEAIRTIATILQNMKS